MIDTHTHIDGEEFAEDRALAIQRAQEAGVEKIFVPAIDLKSIGSVVDTCRQFPGYAYPMIGLHPEEVKEDWKDAVGQMRRILDEQRQKAPSADNPPFIIPMWLWARWDWTSIGAANSRKSSWRLSRSR